MLTRILLNLVWWFISSWKHNFHVLRHWKEFDEHRFSTIHHDGKLAACFCDCGEVFYVDKKMRDQFEQHRAQRMKGKANVQSKPDD